MNIFLLPLTVFPVKNNRILLLNNILNFSAKYACNTKYIAEYLLENYPNEYEIIYPLGKTVDAIQLLQKGLVPVTLGTLKYYYYAVTSRVFITTSGAISYIPFRKGQAVINTWHGGGAYKKAGIDTEHNRFYKIDCKITAWRTKYFVSSSQKFGEVISGALLIDKNKMLDYGLPRNDIFFKDYSLITEAIKSTYNIAKEKKIVLYAPTYRTPENSTFLKHQIGPYEIDYMETLNALQRRFGGEWVFAVRMHPSIADSDNMLPDGIVNMSTYEDVQELLCAADVLINDYSSIMWDFVQTKKPCFTFATDLEKYENSVGMYTIPSSWPFPLAKDQSELTYNIDSFNSDRYLSDVDKYFKWMGNYEKGCACEELCKKIKMITQTGGR